LIHEDTASLAHRWCSGCGHNLHGLLPREQVNQAEHQGKDQQHVIEAAHGVRGENGHGPDR